MADKQSVLSIVLQAVDKASGPVKALDHNLKAMTHSQSGGAASPLASIDEHLGDISKSTGITALNGVLNTIGRAARDAFNLIVEGVSRAVVAVGELVNHFDDIGDKAERLGVTADFLTSMRFAAEDSGASIESLDEGLQSFTQNMGQARAGTGRMLKFLNTVSEPLARQLLATKSNEAAFRLLADAMAKLEDPEKRLALASKTVGDAALAPMLHRGSKGLLELQGEYISLAGSQEDAAEAGGKVDDQLRRIKAAGDGVKAALMQGLAPALLKIIPLMTEWLSGHREQIAEWIVNFGTQLPGAIDKIIVALGEAKTWVNEVADSMGGWDVIGRKLKDLLSADLKAAILEVKVGADALVRGIGMLWKLFEASPIGMLVEHFEDLEDQIELVTESLRKLGALKGLLGPLGLLLPGEDGQGDGVDSVVHPSDHRAGRRDGIDFIVQPNQQQQSDAVDPNTFEGALEAVRRMGERGDKSAVVTVKFENAPRGMRATAAPQNTADVDMSVGYQMLGGVW